MTCFPPGKVVAPATKGGSAVPFGRRFKKSRPAPSRHFDRSEAEWRNLPPLMARAALRWEISRLRVSSKHFSSAPYRHAAPLEMTVATSSIGHTFGVRVDGTSSRRFLRFVSLTAFQAEGCGGGFAANFIMPPFGGHVHIEYHNHSSPRPHRLRWMASHWIRGSRGSPMNPVRLHTLRHFVALFP